MAELPIEITTTVLELQRRLLTIVNQAIDAGFTLLEQYGETEAIINVYEQLQNARERATVYYSRLYTLLLRIAEAYPVASNAMLDLLVQSIEQASATADASEATIRESKRDWDLI
jgi:hypothetical protein